MRAPLQSIDLLTSRTMRRAEVGLFFVLADDPAVGARGDLPVDVARVVARLIGAILGELDRESLAGGSVETGHEAIDDPASDDFDATESGEARGVEQIGAEGAR